MITIENISKHELIGLDTEIINSPNTQIIGLAGTIVDETKSMFVINTKNGQKNIPKKHNTWKFIANSQEIKLSGAILEKRPYDRVGAKL